MATYFFKVGMFTFGNELRCVSTSRLMKKSVFASLRVAPRRHEAISTAESETKSEIVPLSRIPPSSGIQEAGPRRGVYPAIGGAPRSDSQNSFAATC